MMTFRARVLSLVAVATACTSGGGGGELEPGSLVEELSLADQQALYDEFIAALCSTADDPADCSSCIGEVPSDPAFEATLEAECPDVTVAQVRACAEAFAAGQEDAYEICVQGGGCVFDVIDELAPEC